MILKNINDRKTFAKLQKHFCKSKPKHTYYYGSYQEFTVEVYDKATMLTNNVTAAKTIYSGLKDMNKIWVDVKYGTNRYRQLGNDLTSGHYTKPYV